MLDYSPDGGHGAKWGEQHPPGDSAVWAGETMDWCQDGAPAPKGAMGQRGLGVEGGGVGEMWGADVKEAILAKVCSSFSIDILAQTRRLRRAAL